MAQLNGLIVSVDEDFIMNIARRLRSGAVSVHLIDEHAAREGTTPDVVIVDIRAGHTAAMPAIEQLRGRWPNTGIFVVASAVDADLVIQSMRAGANEFFAWPPPAETFDEALRRTAARRAAAPSTSIQATTMVFFGAKGGAGATTLAVNCGVEIARLKKRTLIVDLKAGLGEVTLFLGVRSRYTMLDALDNLHRLDQEFMKELVVKHKSGLEILAGSDLFDRPGSADSGTLEEVFRLLGRQYEYIIVDAGAQMNPCVVSTLYTADAICLVASPDVPSVRNAQRLLDRIGQLGASGDRVKVLLNRTAEPSPIPHAQIESALGHPIFHTFLSDYKTVSTALNSGVPLTLSGNTELSSQFDSFARRMVDPNAVANDIPGKKAPLPLGLQRLASIW
jgi:pilus assembly protein CpaE